MKITFLVGTLNYGGAETQVVGLARKLYERGHSVVVAVFYPGGTLERELREAGVAVRGLNKRRRWNIPDFLLRLAQLLRRERPDVLHSYLGTPNIVAALLKPIFPHIHVVWGVRTSNIDLCGYDWFVRLVYKVECRLSRFADLIIVNSHAGRDHAIATGFLKDRMVVIPNGIDTDRFCPDSKARQRIRAQWGVADNEKLIGLVGRLDPRKDHPTFLRAAKLLAQERADVRFVCVGNGPAGYKQELRALGEKLGLAQRLVWAGTADWFKDMPAVQNALDIATSSSYSEGMPGVVGEAMACGIPCVVTNVGDSAWMVGERELVVPPSDPEALAARWLNIIDKPNEARSQIGLRLRQRVVDNFSLDRLAEQTNKVLRDLGCESQ